MDYCGPVKTSCKGFFLAMSEKLTKEWSVVSYLVIKSTTIFNGDRHLVAIRYKLKSWKVIWFISIEGSVNTDPGDTYLFCYPHTYSNVSICPVVCPNVLGGYFNASIAIDNYNNIQK